MPQETIQIDLNKVFIQSREGNCSILEFKQKDPHLIIYDPGLFHTAICKSAISKIDRENGKLYYRNTNLKEKIHEDFLDVAFELIFGSDERKNDFREAVQKHFRLYEEQKTLLNTIPFNTDPMDVLGSAVTLLNGIEKKYLKNPHDLIEKSAFLVASVATFVSYRFTLLNHTDWTPSNVHSSFAEAILTRMHPEKDSEKLQKLGKLLNVIMILHAEHGQNCSTCTVRNVASAKGSLYASVGAAMAAFNGLLHAGASQFIPGIYDELLKNDLDIESYIKEKLNKKEILIGFGHRIYNCIPNCWDSRVEVMYEILTHPTFDFPEIALYKKIALQLIEFVAQHPFFKKRNLSPNPDLLNCLFYQLFGMPREFNTAMLCLGRVAGWIAHFIEHTEDQMPLSRPRDLFKNS